jgi:hypothetical protein
MLHMLSNWITVRRTNYRLIDLAAAKVADELKTVPYRHLIDPSYPLDGEKMVDGILLSWHVEIPRRKRNGDIHVSVDFYADLPTLFGGKPSHQFWKSLDGSVIEMH